MPKDLGLYGVGLKGLQYVQRRETNMPDYETDKTIFVSKFRNLRDETQNLH